MQMSLLLSLVITFTIMCIDLSFDFFHLAKSPNDLLAAVYDFTLMTISSRLLVLLHSYQ